MNIPKMIYQLKNWPATLRYLTQGGGNSDGLVTFQGELAATLIKGNGKVRDLGVIARRVVTDAGVQFMAQDFNAGSKDITNFNFHDSGTGTNAEAVGDTDLQTAAGPTTRATGTQSNPTNPTYRTVGTINYTTTLAITEHGIFNQAARGAGTVLWDRSVFSAINVVNGDAIQFQYTLTITSGG